MAPIQPKKGAQILWSAVSRDNVVLAECDCGEVNRVYLKTLAQKLLAKKPTPGWEYEKANGLCGIKFHIHGDVGGPVVWAMCCVYAQGVPDVHARGFLEKLCFLTEPLRDTPLWQSGKTLAAQDSFAPTLLQRMEQANSQGSLAMVSDQVNEVKQMMHSNIELLCDRGEKLEALDEKASAMAKMSQTFRKQARKAKKFHLWQQAKFGMAAGSAVTAGVAVVSIPPLIAAMGPGAGIGVGVGAAVAAGAAVGVKVGR